MLVRVPFLPIFKEAPGLPMLNRCMGLEDAYPFKLTEAVKDKLRFIHRHVLEKVFKSSK